MLSALSNFNVNNDNNNNMFTVVFKSSLISTWHLTYSVRSLLYYEIRYKTNGQIIKLTM